MLKINVNVKVGSATFEQTYVLVETRAPRAYDYHGVIQVEDGGTSRIVAIPESDLAMQTGRYQSGMYGARAFDTQEDPLTVSEDVILDLIVARLLAHK